MVKNRVFAVVFRFISAAVTITGLVLGSGLSGGPARLLSYTDQSNLLCALYFVYAASRAGYDAIKKGMRGSACYSPAFAGGVLVTILFTMIIFWGVLAPNTGGQRLLGAGNLILHTFSPLLMLADYVMFCQKCTLKKRDTLVFALFPVVYVAQSLILAACGFVFYTKDGIQHHYPYLFMDFKAIGFWAAVAVTVISAMFVGASLLLIFVNNKDFRRRQRLDTHS
ncbi:MAG: Pr6Pr family membrane protein [Firmicutes bacterium]|nr:Pr6Pr family membrane protein [Bacillota bacterium]